MEVTFELDRGVLLRLDREAQLIGVHREELLRVVLGQRFMGFLDGPWAHPVVGQASGASPQPQQLVDPAGPVARILALMGNLKCKGCTQTLTITDVERKSCCKCETPIFV